MKISKVIKSLGFMYVCVSGTHEKPYFFVCTKASALLIEQKIWQNICEGNQFKRQKPGDLPKDLREKILGILASLPKEQEEKTPYYFKNEKKIKYVLPRQNFYKKRHYNAPY